MNLSPVHCPGFHGTKLIRRVPQIALAQKKKLDASGGKTKVRHREKRCNTWETVTK